MWQLRKNCLITWKLAATGLGICLVAAWLHHRCAIFPPHGTRSAGKEQRHGGIPRSRRRLTALRGLQSLRWCVMREKHLQGVCLCVNSQDWWGVVSAFGFCFRVPRRLLFFLTPKINHQKMPPRSMAFLLGDRLPMTT